MTPPIAETGMTAVGPETAFGASTPGSAIGAVTPECMPLAAIREAPITAAIREATLTVVTLAMNIARETIAITVEMPPLASAQISISPEGPLFAAHVAGLTLQVARLAACQVALPHALTDALLLRLLACVDTAFAHAALTLRRHGGHRDHARE
ncbi:MAG: hypothetical protein OEP48_09495 [Betaproteobacteria bacterium]|nr:hypothetical protein [Betaproteobacteria bacterium]MDH3435510.1 hypothetical protein [Betaproteobacteria bacterium]